MLIELIIKMIGFSQFYPCSVVGECCEGGGEAGKGLSEASPSLEKFILWVVPSFEVAGLHRAFIGQKYPGQKNEYHEKKLLQNSDFSIYLLWHIYQLNIFRNYFKAGIQAWNTS